MAICGDSLFGCESIFDRFKHSASCADIFGYIFLLHIMHVIDVVVLLENRSVELPCGPNLEYSPGYIEVARLMQGSPEVQYGKMYIAAGEPNWKAVKALTLELLAQSHDLRLATWLTRALVSLHGFDGLSDGLALIEGMIERHWDNLYPQVDEDDDNDPTVRINALLALDDKDGLVSQVCAIRFAQAAGHGHFNLRDIEIAEGERAAAADEVVPEISAIDATFMAMPYEGIRSTELKLCESIDRMARIDSLVTEQTGRERMAGLAALSKALIRLRRIVSSRLEQHPGRVVESELRNESDAQADVLDATALETRQDVLRQLDRLCAYYANREPASPVPLLLQRARRLVNMNFLEILTDLSPTSIDEVRRVAGIGST